MPGAPIDNSAQARPQLVTFMAHGATLLISLNRIIHPRDELNTYRNLAPDRGASYHCHVIEIPAGEVGTEEWD